MTVDADSAPSILAKAFTLLAAFTAEKRVMSLSEIARASELPKSTVHRLLARLVELGAIEHHRSGYRIGLAMFQMAARTPAVGMRDLATPMLAALQQRTQLTVHLAVLRQFDVVVLERIAPRNLPSKTAGPGACLPANCTALGKALLAFEDMEDLPMFLPRPMPNMTSESVVDVDELLAELCDVRRLQVARDRGEAQSGVCCVAVPVVVMASAVAAVSVAHPVGTSLPVDVEPSLREVAARIGREVQAGLTGSRTRWFPREIDL